jgi:Reverse transcriptase (RNA-dependent DNA polymerase)
MISRSLLTGTFPDIYKAAFITPIIRKHGLDFAAVKSYRPISNLSVVSKLLERLVLRQVVNYLQSITFFSGLQSAYRPHHSTETAVLKVYCDILEAVDDGDVASLVLLDLSAAFNRGLRHPTLAPSVFVWIQRSCLAVVSLVFNWSD